MSRFIPWLLHFLSLLEYDLGKLTLTSLALVCSFVKQRPEYCISLILKCTLFRIFKSKCGLSGKQIIVCFHSLNSAHIKQWHVSQSMMS